MSLTKEGFEKAKQAGIIHKKVKEHILSIMKPDMKLFDLAEIIETKIREYGGNRAFPTGLSLNNCAAHFSPHSSDDTHVYTENDVLKIDYGVHIDGYIVDAAFTHSFNEKHRSLIDATIEATNKGIEMAKPGVLMSDIGAEIQKTIESRENFKSVIDLCGHSIGRYKIHDGQAIPNIAFPLYKERMRDNQLYAIETFASTGKGRALSKENVPMSCDLISHFALTNAKTKDNKQLYKRFGTLPFCKRWLNNKEKIILNRLIREKTVVSYPPLYDNEGAFISQHEHTIAVFNGEVTVLS